MLAVASASGNNLSVIKIDEQGGLVSIANFSPSIARFDDANNPAFSSDGRLIYIGASTGDRLFAIDSESAIIIDSISIASPERITVATQPNGIELIAATRIRRPSNSKPGGVTVIGNQDGRLTSRSELTPPDGIDFSLANNVVFTGDASIAFFGSTTGTLFAFNSATGENLRGFEFSFDAVELINSGALRTDLMQVFHDWFALLNYGYRITGLGASDSHDVSRFIVGQGRTYIFCNDSDPAHIDIHEACANLRAGRALVSLGLLVDMTVQGKFRVGDLATNLPEGIEVTTTISAPQWSQADRVELYANGVKIHESALRTNSARITWTIPRPARDALLVAIASGPGITSPHWAIPKPYQPSSKAWNLRVLGATNPIWLDADGDGKFTPLRLQKTK